MKAIFPEHRSPIFDTLPALIDLDRVEMPARIASRGRQREEADRGGRVRGGGRCPPVGGESGSGAIAPVVLAESNGLQANPGEPHAG
jgi:hypothetical protein